MKNIFRILLSFLFFFLLFSILTGPRVASAQGLTLSRSKVNGRSRVTAITLPSKHQITYEYDDKGNMLAKTFANFFNSKKDGRYVVSREVNADNSDYDLGVLRETFAPVTLFPDFAGLFSQFFTEQNVNDIYAQQNDAVDQQEKQRLATLTLRQKVDELVFLQAYAIWSRIQRRHKKDAVVMFEKAFKVSAASISLSDKSRVANWLIEQIDEATKLDSRNSDLNDYKSMRVMDSKSMPKEFALLETTLQPIMSCQPTIYKLVKTKLDKGQIYFDPGNTEVANDGSMIVNNLFYTLPTSYVDDVRSKIFAGSEILKWSGQMNQVYLDGWKSPQSSQLRRQQYGDAQFQLTSIGDEKFPWLTYVLVHEFGHTLQSPLYAGRFSVPIFLNQVSQGMYAEELLTPFAKYLKKLAETLDQLQERSAYYFAMDALAGCM